jgi:hypothetical protein
MPPAVVDSSGEAQTSHLPKPLPSALAQYTQHRNRYLQCRIRRSASMHRILIPVTTRQPPRGWSGRTSRKKDKGNFLHFNKRPQNSHGLSCTCCTPGPLFFHTWTPVLIHSERMNVSKWPHLEVSPLVGESSHLSDRPYCCLLTLFGTQNTTLDPYLASINMTLTCRSPRLR